jgi:hypothetical protein
MKRSLWLSTYHKDDDCVWPDRVNIIYQVDVGVVVVSSRDVIGVTVVVTAHLDDNQVGRLLCANIPFLGCATISRGGTRARIRGMMPEPLLM